MMSKYGGREEKRIEDAYGDSDIQSTQYRRMQASLVPSHKWQEGQFLDNKIDLFGQEDKQFSTLMNIICYSKDWYKQ